MPDARDLREPSLVDDHATMLRVIRGTPLGPALYEHQRTLARLRATMTPEQLREADARERGRERAKERERKRSLNKAVHAARREVRRRYLVNERPPPRDERPTCGARCRDGSPCRARVCWSDWTVRLSTRCRVHGGLSRGPSKEGRAKVAEVMRARWAAWRVGTGPKPGRKSKAPAGG